MSASPAAATPAHPPGSLRGIGLFLCALVLLATLDALAKDVVQRWPAPMVNMVRYGVVLLMATALMLRGALPLTLRPPRFKSMALRGVMLGLVGNTFMPALKTMPLAEATAIYFVSPLIVVALSPWLLGEKVGTAQWLASGAGFCGMLLIVRPGGDLPLAGCALMAVAAFAYAMVQILTRRLAGHVGMEQQFFFSALICTAMTVVPALLDLPQHLPSARDAGLMLLVGLLSGTGQCLLIKAFQSAPASALGPLNYVHLLLAVAFSSLAFGQPPGTVSLVGMLVIACSGLWLTLPALRAHASGWTARRALAHEKGLP